MHSLPFIWGGIIAFIIMMYVLLDGFDLGVGILFPFTKNEYERDIMMNSIAPVWDGNETWMVMGGASLYGAFPVVYSTLLPTLYLPLMLMLGALIYRGIAFEFRPKADRSKFLWNISFTLGSVVAAFCQGVVLGTFVKGYPIQDGILVIGNYQWLTPFSFMTGIGVVIGYALLGATWMLKKSDGELHVRMRRYAKTLMILLLLFFIGVSIWTPFIDPRLMMRWFSMPNMLYLAPLPIVSMGMFLWLWYSLKQDYHNQPFSLTITLFTLAYFGFCISIWPYIIPPYLTLWDAAAPATSQLFCLIGMIILMPILLGYTYYSYFVFRGKVKPGETHY